jgi:DNA segregation ATPase FtsK/SpoIIIE-like protein
MNRNRAARWITLSVLMFSLSAASFAGVFVGVSVRIGPPALPVYAQPICPGPGYLWTPGYWAWDDFDGYYWVPGTWVLAPVGMLWTPGYWGWYGGFYHWHAGYWGPHVGFYGGINYGFGYGGVGFWGGEWRGDRFFYNRSVTNINVVNVRNVYERNVVVNNNHVAFNGGNGGVRARPTREEERYANEPHTARLAAQTEHEHAARQNRALFASENHGRPAIAATGRPGEFRGRSVVAAREAGAAYHEPRMSPQAARASAGENRGKENRRNENRSAENRNAQNRNNENRGNEMRAQSRNENNREMPRPQSGGDNTQVYQSKAQQRQQHQQAQQEQKEQQRQARQEQQQQRQQQKQQAQQQRAERQQAQRAQKQQRQEQQREGRGTGR